MRITYPGATNNIPRFTTLDKVILSGGEGLDNLTLYYGSDTSLLDLDDFNEYGWEFLVKKYRYNSFCPLGLLTTHDKKEVIGYKSTDIENVSKCFFPSLVEEEDTTEGDLIQYFGTLSVGRQKLTMIRIPPGYSNADIQDTTDENPSKINIEFEDNEIKYYKIIWFILTPGEKNRLVDINLSYISWEISNNPFRNQDKYLLREEDKFDIVHNIDVVENIGTVSNPHWLDQSSGTIIGNRNTSSHPLLDLICNYYKDNTDWDENVSYKRGQVCSYNNNTWISLENNNRGNNPIFSNLWSLESLFSKDFTISRAVITTRLEVDDETVDYGEVTPTILIATTSIEEYELTIYCRNGYVPSTIENDQTKEVIDLTGGDPDGTSMYYWDAYTSGNGFCKVIIPTSFVEHAEEIIITYKQFVAECLSFYENINTNTTTVRGYDIFHIGDIVTLNFSTDSGKIIKDILVECTVNQNVIKTEVLPVPDESSDEPNKYTLTDFEIKYPAIYRITCRYIESEYYTFRVLEHEGFFVDNMTKKTPINNVEVVTFSFYPEDGRFSNFTINIKEGDTPYVNWPVDNEPNPGSVPIDDDTISLKYIKDKCFQLIFGEPSNNYTITFNKNDN